MIKVKRKNKKILQQRGITLVALVISIIILLILAGISIQAITNQGLFGRANEAKEKSEIANIKEQIALDIYEKQLEPPLGSITEGELETILGKYGTVNKEDGKIVGITTAKGYEILLKDIYGGKTIEVTVPDGAIITPVNDITTWLKTGEISNQYSYTTIEQVIADSTCIESLMNNENAMKYLARSTEFANAICASETTMTYLGKSTFVDDTVLNSDYWLIEILDSAYIDKVLSNVVPTMTQNSQDGVILSSYYENPDKYPLCRLTDRVITSSGQFDVTSSTICSPGSKVYENTAYFQIEFSEIKSVCEFILYGTYLVGQEADWLRWETLDIPVDIYADDNFIGTVTLLKPSNYNTETPSILKLNSKIRAKKFRFYMQSNNVLGYGDGTPMYYNYCMNEIEIYVRQ